MFRFRSLNCSAASLTLLKLRRTHLAVEFLPPRTTVFLAISMSLRIYFFWSKLKAGPTCSSSFRNFEPARMSLLAIFSLARIGASITVSGVVQPCYTKPRRTGVMLAEKSRKSIFYFSSEFSRRNTACTCIWFVSASYLLRNA